MKKSNAQTELEKKILENAENMVSFILSQEKNNIIFTDQLCGRRIYVNVAIRPRVGQLATIVHIGVGLSNNRAIFAGPNFLKNNGPGFAILNYHEEKDGVKFSASANFDTDKKYTELLKYYRYENKNFKDLVSKASSETQLKEICKLAFRDALGAHLANAPIIPLRPQEDKKPPIVIDTRPDTAYKLNGNVIKEIPDPAQVPNAAPIPKGLSVNGTINNNVRINSKNLIVRPADLKPIPGSKL